MNKHDFIKKVATTTGYTMNDVGRVIEATIEEIIEIIKNGDSVMLFGLGEFSGRIRPAHEVRNPMTEEKRMVGDYMEPRFRMSKKFRDSLKAAAK